MTPAHSLPGSMLAARGLVLCWSDLDLDSRGSIIDASALVGLEIAPFPTTYRPRGAISDHAFNGADVSEVHYGCCGPIRGTTITQARAHALVQFLVGARPSKPAWVSYPKVSDVPLPQYELIAEPPAWVRCLVLEATCERHGDCAHCQGWSTRIWVDRAEDTRAVADGVMGDGVAEALEAAYVASREREVAHAAR